MVPRTPGLLSWLRVGLLCSVGIQSQVTQVREANVVGVQDQDGWKAQNKKSFLLGAYARSVLAFSVTTR